MHGSCCEPCEGCLAYRKHLHHLSSHPHSPACLLCPHAGPMAANNGANIHVHHVGKLAVVFFTMTLIRRGDDMTPEILAKHVLEWQV